MSDYQGACNTGGFASMEHQQERARQAIRATIAGGNGDVNSIRYDIYIATGCLVRSIAVVSELN